MKDREAAQQRVNQIRTFRAELDALRAAGILLMSDDQRAAIGAYHDELLTRLATDYDIDRTEAAGRLSRGMQLASFFAAVTLTAAVYSLVSRFWGRFDLPVQATLLCAFPLMSLVGVELSARRERTLYVASLFALVAYGTFWLAVGVLSDTLNIPLAPPWLWAGVVFGLALALAYRFSLILAMSLCAMIAALSGSLFQASGYVWTHIFEDLDVLTMTAFGSTLLAPQLRQRERGFALVTRLVGFGVALLGLLIMSTSGDSSLLPISNRTTELVYQGVILVVCVTLLVIGIRRRWNETVRLAAGMLTLFLLVRYIDWFWDSLPNYVFFAMLAGIALAWLLALRRIRGRLAKSQAVPEARIAG